MRSYKSDLYVDTVYLCVDTFVTIAFYCMYTCMNVVVHTVAFYNCQYRYC